MKHPPWSTCPSTCTCTCRTQLFYEVITCRSCPEDEGPGGRSSRMEHCMHISFMIVNKHKDNKGALTSFRVYATTKSHKNVAVRAEKAIHIRYMYSKGLLTYAAVNRCSLPLLLFVFKSTSSHMFVSSKRIDRSVGKGLLLRPVTFFIPLGIHKFTRKKTVAVN